MPQFKAAYEKLGFTVKSSNLDYFLGKFIPFVQNSLAKNGLKIKSKNYDVPLSNEIHSENLTNGFSYKEFCVNGQKIVIACNYLGLVNNYKQSYVTVRTLYDKNELGYSIEKNFSEKFNTPLTVMRGCLYYNLNFKPVSVYGPSILIDLNKLKSDLSSIFHIKFEDNDVRNLLHIATVRNKAENYKLNPFYVAKNFAISGEFSSLLKPSGYWKIDNNLMLIPIVRTSDNVKSVLLTLSVHSLPIYDQSLSDGWKLNQYGIYKPIVNIPSLFTNTLETVY